MNHPIAPTLHAAFTNLAAICHSDLSLDDIDSVGEAGLSLCLRRTTYVHGGDEETERHSAAFTWDEMTDTTLDISALAVQRWDAAKAAWAKERDRKRREREAAEARAAKRRKAARKGSTTKRELATLTRLAAKHNVHLS